MNSTLSSLRLPNKKPTVESSVRRWARIRANLEKGVNRQTSELYCRNNTRTPSGNISCRQGYSLAPRLSSFAPGASRSPMFGSFRIGMTREQGKCAINLFREHHPRQLVRKRQRRKRNPWRRCRASDSGNPAAAPQRNTSSRLPRSRHDPIHSANCCELNFFPSASSSTTVAPENSRRFRLALNPLATRESRSPHSGGGGRRNRPAAPEFPAAASCPGRKVEFASGEPFPHQAGYRRWPPTSMHPDAVPDRARYESAFRIYCKPYFLRLSSSVLRLMPRISAARVIL